MAFTYTAKSSTGITEVDFVFSDGTTDFLFSDGTDFVFLEGTADITWSNSTKNSASYSYVTLN